MLSKKLVTGILCLLAYLGNAQPKKNRSVDSRLVGLDTAFAQVLKDWKVAGFAVAVVEKDKVVYAKGVGYKDWENKLPVTENTVFAIGSCTKAFTASLLGLLNDSGKVNLDKPVRTYLPDLHFYTSEMDNNITLRDMMCHRTGISRYDWSWSVNLSQSRDTLMRRIRHMEPTEPLRQTFQYNNFMFMLQGQVAEKLTGKSWDDQVRETFFQPLGMQHSNTSFSGWMQEKDLATGYDLKKDSIIQKVKYEDDGGMAPCGSITSNVVDMAQWLKLWIEGGQYNGKKILSAQYVKAAITPQMVVPDGWMESRMADIQMPGYGLGWFLSSYRGHYRVEHGGNVTGFSASTCFFPADSIGIVVLCNQDGSTLPGVVRNIIADKLLGTSYRDWETLLLNEYRANKAKGLAQRPKVNTSTSLHHPPTHPLSDYTGTYTAVANESFTIWQNGDSLFVTTPSAIYWYRPYNYDVFELLTKDDTTEEIDAATIAPLKVVFGMDEAGMIANIACIFPDGNSKPAVFTKVKKPIADGSAQQEK